MLEFIEHNCLFWVVALIVSSYYGIRGAVFCSVYRRKDMQDWKKWQKAVVWYVQDSIFNFVCGLAGFLSLRLLVPIWASFSRDFSNVSSGSAILLGLLSVIAILGISGALPRILSRYGFPK
jgi:hypothetical protein